jgi:hypothetical protein
MPLINIFPRFLRNPRIGGKILKAYLTCSELVPEGEPG